MRNAHIKINKAIPLGILPVSERFFDELGQS
jgi:hypothetical protein